MLEHMIQGVARAGGIEVPPGREVLPPRRRPARRYGTPRRVIGAVLRRASVALDAWSERMLEQRSRCPAP